MKIFYRDKNTDKFGLFSNSRNVDIVFFTAMFIPPIVVIILVSIFVY